MISSVGIASANKLSVSDAANPLPSMRETITGWFRPLVLVRVTKTETDFEVSESRKELKCMGAIQPFGPRELKIKSEGERSWNWNLLHTTPDVALKNDEEFMIKGKRYRVMSQKDWSEYGYIAYELVQDYVAANVPDLPPDAN
jgi:hypothetical protein